MAGGIGRTASRIAHNASVWVGRKVSRTGEKLIRPNSYASFTLCSMISKLRLDFILHCFRISAHSVLLHAVQVICY